MDSTEGAASFARALVDVHASLDWELLGRLYCHEGGDAFFAPEQIVELQEAGLLLASELAGSLTCLPEPFGTGQGRSLYLGAALAELAPALCEALVLGREVVLVNLPGPEVHELGRVLADVSAASGLALPHFHTDALAELPRGAFEHLWMTSVLTDPEAFPALHDRLYGRTGELATGRGDAEEETHRAEELVRTAVGRLARPAALTTTDEELAFLRPELQRRGWGLAVPEHGRLSAVVGDVVRFCRVV